MHTGINPLCSRETMIRQVSALVAVSLLLHCTNAVFPGEQWDKEGGGVRGYTYDSVAAVTSAVVQRPKPVECVLVQGVGIPVNVSDPPLADASNGWRCIVDSHKVYELVGLPANFTQSLEARDSGTTLLSISSALLNQETKKSLFQRPRSIQITSGADLTISRIPIVKDGTVQAGDPTGQHSLLVVRVSDDTGDAPMSADDLLNGIFTDALNLRNQYQACSGNKLEFVSAGVKELTIQQTVSGVARSTVAEWAADEFRARYGDYSQWTHVMYVFPSSVDFGKAAAYAFVGNGLSVFSNAYVTDLLVLMHEIGHNLGHVHSGADGIEYADRTCMMGAHIYENDGPRMCFNGAKSWFFGWYSKRGGHVTIQDSWHGKLAGIHAYLQGQTTEGDHSVVAQVVRPGTDNHLYLMFNRKEGVNDEVAGDGDMVTVVEQNGPEQQSWKLAALQDGEEFTTTNWNGQSSLTIKVCERIIDAAQGPDYARVIVYQSGSPLTCESPLSRGESGPVTESLSPIAPPTPAPSPASVTPQTPPPTSRPSSPPTATPTSSPTVATPSPTISKPSRKPSTQRSAEPTSKPSNAPSDLPSFSLMPSWAPSSDPSAVPTESSMPSSVPTSEPSEAPSFSAAPSTQPTVSQIPTLAPSSGPSAFPSESSRPSVSPSREPSEAPSRSATPSETPSLSAIPSETPTTSREPSLAPSRSSEPSSEPSNPPITIWDRYVRNGQARP